MQVFTTLSSQLQRQGPKDKRGDKQIFHFTLFFWCTEFQGRDLGLLRVLMGSAYKLYVHVFCIFCGLWFTYVLFRACLMVCVVFISHLSRFYSRFDLIFKVVDLYESVSHVF